MPFLDHSMAFQNDLMSQESLANLNHRGAFCTIAFVDNSEDLENMTIITERSSMSMIIFYGSLNAIKYQGNITANLVRPLLVLSEVQN